MVTRRNLVVYVLLAAVWALVAVWQAEEHSRFREVAKNDLRNRSKDIANTVSACVRGLRFRGAVVLQERLEPVLDEMVNGRSNELVTASELLGIALLNAAEEPIASAGGTCCAPAFFGGGGHAFSATGDPGAAWARRYGRRL